MCKQYIEGGGNQIASENNSRPVSSQTEHLSTIQDIGAADNSSDEGTEHFNYNHDAEKQH